MKSIALILLLGLSMSSSYAAENTVLAHESEFVFFGFLGFTDVDNADVDFTKYEIACSTLSQGPQSPIKYSAKVTEPGYFSLSCPGFLKQNISCFVLNAEANISLPITFDISGVGISRVIKPSSPKLFTPIGIDLTNGTAEAGEISEDNTPDQQ